MTVQSNLAKVFFTGSLILSVTFWGNSGCSLLRALTGGGEEQHAVNWVSQDLVG